MLPWQRALLISTAVVPLVGPPPPPPPASPFLLAGGNETTIAAGASPRVNTLAIAPVGSTIVAAMMVADGQTPTGFVAGANAFTSSGSPGAPFWPTVFETYQCPPLTVALAAGSPIGPNLTGSGRVYMLVFCIPGATTKDPEAATITDDTSGGDYRSTTLPANATQPQVVSLFVLTSSNGSSMSLDAGFTELGVDVAMDTPGGNFGIKGGVKKLTAISGSPSAVGANFLTGLGGGTAGTAAQRTTKVAA